MNQGPFRATSLILFVQFGPHFARINGKIRKISRGRGGDLIVTGPEAISLKTAAL